MAHDNDIPQPGPNDVVAPIMVYTGKCPSCGQEHTLPVEGSISHVPIVQCPKTRAAIRIPPSLVGSVEPFRRLTAEHKTPSYWKVVE